MEKNQNHEQAPAQDDRSEWYLEYTRYKSPNEGKALHEHRGFRYFQELIDFLVQDWSQRLTATKRCICLEL